MTSLVAVLFNLESEQVKVVKAQTYGDQLTELTSTTLSQTSVPNLSAA